MFWWISSKYSSKTKFGSISPVYSFLWRANSSIHFSSKPYISSSSFISLFLPRICKSINSFGSGIPFKTYIMWFWLYFAKSDVYDFFKGAEVLLSSTLNAPFLFKLNLNFAKLSLKKAALSWTSVRLYSF